MSNFEFFEELRHLQTLLQKLLQTPIQSKEDAFRLIEADNILKGIIGFDRLCEIFREEQLDAKFYLLAKLLAVIVQVSHLDSIGSICRAIKHQLQDGGMNARTNLFFKEVFACNTISENVLSFVHHFWQETQCLPFSTQILCLYACKRDNKDLLLGDVEMTLMKRTYDISEPLNLYFTSSLLKNRADKLNFQTIAAVWKQALALIEAMDDVQNENSELFLCSAASWVHLHLKLCMHLLLHSQQNTEITHKKVNASVVSLLEQLESSDRTLVSVVSVDDDILYDSLFDAFQVLSKLSNNKFTSPSLKAQYQETIADNLLEMLRLHDFDGTELMKSLFSSESDSSLKFFLRSFKFVLEHEESFSRLFFSAQHVSVSPKFVRLLENWNELLSTEEYAYLKPLKEVVNKINIVFLRSVSSTKRYKVTPESR